MGRAHAHEHAGQRAILGGHVRAAAAAIRDQVTGGRAPHAAAAAGESQEVVDYIRNAAAGRGIDPNVAVRVARSEGLKGFNPATGHWSSGSNDAGTSFGPFQSHFKSNVPGFTARGLGDDFLGKGVDVRKMANWKKAIDLPLDRAKTHGWGDWHGWRGPPRAGLDWHGAPGRATPTDGHGIPLSGGAAGRGDSLSGMQPDFRARLQEMFRHAPPGSSVFSGYRSEALQAQLYANSDRSGRMVARPGHSHHGMGDAADIRGNLQWFHEHAGEYGLRFPMPWERWHIESDPNTKVPAPQGLDADIRQRAGAAHTIKHEGHAKVSVDFRGMPRGVKVAGKGEGIFQEVSLHRGRAAPIAEG